jgi:hypothetical protein
MENFELSRQIKIKLPEQELLRQFFMRPSARFGKLLMQMITKLAQVKIFRLNLMVA